MLGLLEREANRVPDAERAALLEDGARIAEKQLSPDAALPWLERLRAARPGEASPLRRIAEIHRKAGRSGALLIALADALRLASAPDQVRRLALERARVLETQLGLPGCAIAPLEQARALAPGDPEILGELERLYGAAGRQRERAELIEERLAALPEEAARERAELHRSAAELWASIADPERAFPHWMHAVAGFEPGGAEHRTALRAAGAAAS